MTGSQQIRDAIRRMAGLEGPPPTLLATVTAVDEPGETCTVKDELELSYTIRLHPTIGTGECVTILPAVGSLVLAVRVESEDNWMLLACDNAEKVKMQVGDTTVELKDGVLISRNGDGLKEIISDLVTEILAIYAPKNVANIAAIQLRIDQLLKPA
jgi:hypothetical protein